MIQPGAAEDELPQPVDERLALDERHALPVPHEVAAEAAAGLRDHPVGGKLHEILGLLLVELVPVEQPELHGGGGDALLEIPRVEAETEAEELDDVVLARPVVRLRHGDRVPRSYAVFVRRLILWIAGPLCVLGALAVAWLFELSTEHVLVLAPVIVVGTGAVVGLALLGRAWRSTRFGALSDVDGRSDRTRC